MKNVKGTYRQSLMVALLLAACILSSCTSAPRSDHSLAYLQRCKEIYLDSWRSLRTYASEFASGEPDHERLQHAQVGFTSVLERRLCDGVPEASLAAANNLALIYFFDSADSQARELLNRAVDLNSGGSLLPLAGLWRVLADCRGDPGLDQLRVAHLLELGGAGARAAKQLQQIERIARCPTLRVYATEQLKRS